MGAAGTSGPPLSRVVTPPCPGAGEDDADNGGHRWAGLDAVCVTDWLVVVGTMPVVGPMARAADALEVAEQETWSALADRDPMMDLGG